ncbi:nuclear transport factor 2 family protein [Aquiflexum sp. LQ15W]|uniref:nuclear transport factor 2 family protein n=1 Tax=Cognataquiflexum nitidum TaxID=2922272 RepID=UPI001F1313BD|nr:nuclear transport factor 2 family protein [Cognataquiflexum nitidum]MCH6198250.1 nuclear transport factor 2 family protein [Cognataquiflexum nitidum]
MKYFMLIGIFVLTLVGCTSKQRYSQDSPEIDTVKSLFENYLTGNWDAYKSHFADNAKIFINVTEKNPANIQELIAQQKMEIEGLSSYSINTETQTFEMILDDKEETWVNYWGVWKGTLAATQEIFEIPIHITFQFVDGKIVKEFGYWDNSKITMAVMRISIAKASKSLDKASD